MEQSRKDKQCVTPVLVSRPTRSKRKGSNFICDTQSQGVMSTNAKFCWATPPAMRCVFSVLVGDGWGRRHLCFFEDVSPPLAKDLLLTIFRMNPKQRSACLALPGQFEWPRPRSNSVLMLLVFCHHGWEFADDPWKFLTHSVWQLDISVVKLGYFPAT